MRPLYKIRFQIQPKAGTLAAVGQECLGYIEDWVDTSHAKGRVVSPGVRRTSEIDTALDLPQLRSSELKEGPYFHTFYWGKRDERDKSQRWVTVIDLVSDGLAVDFQLQLGVESATVALEGQRPKPARPRLISTLLSHPGWECRSGNQPLSILPNVITLGGVEPFCNDVLFSPERDLPVVVMTPSGTSIYPPVNAQKLAERLGGSARVFRVRDRVAAQVLDQYLGSQLAIGPDAVRVFAPGLQPGSGVDGHWHLLGVTIREKGLTDFEFADFLFTRLAERSLVRFRESPLIARFKEMAGAERARRLEELRAEKSADHEYYETYTRDLEAEIQRLKSERQGLLDQILDRDADIDRLTRERDTAQENIRQLTLTAGVAATLAETPAEPLVEPPANVLEAVRAARDSSPDVLYLESALEAAEDVPVTYKFVDRVFSALRAIQEASSRRNAAGRVPGGWKSLFETLGVEYKPALSMTTRNTWGDDYKFLYEGKRQLFEEHFTIGVKSANTCVSIHFSTKLRDDTIVVAYVGRHLRNTQT